MVRAVDINCLNQCFSIRGHLTADVIRSCSILRWFKLLSPLITNIIGWVVGVLTWKCEGQGAVAWFEDRAMEDEARLPESVVGFFVEVEASWAVSLLLKCLDL